jgi:hypothetical protein
LHFYIFTPYEEYSYDKKPGQELEWKEKELKGKRKKLSKRISKYKDVVPLTEDVAALGIGVDELLALKVGINQSSKSL